MKEREEAAGMDLSCFSGCYYLGLRCAGREGEAERPEGRERERERVRGKISQKEKEEKRDGEIMKERKSEMLQALIINTPATAAHESFMSNHTAHR